MPLFDETMNCVSVRHRVHHNCLHITCDSFEQPQAHAVLGLLQKYGGHCTNFFIDVQNIQSPEATVAKGFKSAISRSGLSPQQIFFKGKTGFELAVNGNRVLLKKSGEQKGKDHVCCGRCNNCHCHKD